MVRIGVVYSIVRDLCNKDQKGFVTPAVFNTLAEVAQLNVYNEMFNELKLATRLRRSGSDAGRDKSAYKMVEEDLSHFIRTHLLNVGQEELGEDGTLTPDDLVLNAEGGPIQATDANGNLLFDADGLAVLLLKESVASVLKPSDLSRIISMNVFDTNTSVEIIYDAEKAKRVLNSNLSTPTEDFPVALIDGDNIDIFPQTISSDINIKYYRLPETPIYTVSEISDGFIIENQAGSVDFELPPHYLRELVGEIVRMIGVRLRDDVLTQYGVAETTNN